jgi:antibiotic biosynthesis monooxygenase (ABM) superfamily enzyme
MVFHVLRYNILPDKAEAYDEWVRPAIQRALAVPGVVELRAYRPITGPFQVTSIWEFTDLATWSAWYAHEDVQKNHNELRAFTADLTPELWDSSPVVPEPIRPGE